MQPRTTVYLLLFQFGLGLCNLFLVVKDLHLTDFDIFHVLQNLLGQFTGLVNVAISFLLQLVDYLTLFLSFIFVVLRRKTPIININAWFCYQGNLQRFNCTDLVCHYSITTHRLHLWFILEIFQISWVWSFQPFTNMVIFFRYCTRFSRLWVELLVKKKGCIRNRIVIGLICMKTLQRLRFTPPYLNLLF